MTNSLIRFSVVLIATALLFGALGIAVSFAQSPQANLVVTTELGTNTPHPGTQATVTVNGAGASLSGTPGPTNSVQYSTNFNDTKVVSMWPSSYSVAIASVSGYSYTYSTSCFGVTNAGETRTCTVTAVKTGAATGSARLTVYTNAINNNGGSKTPGDFTVVVSGSNVSLASFAGNSGGTTVFLDPGTYSADVLTAVNYSRSRSGDCSGVISSGESRSCIITLDDLGSAAGAYTAPLTCTPGRQAAAVGQTITFDATGGGPVYNWATANRVYLNVGPRLVVIEEGAGTQTAIVSSNHETALCIVDANTSGTYVPPGTVRGISTGPGLPNTGGGGSLWLTIFTLALLGAAVVFFGIVGRRGVLAILAK